MFLFSFFQICLGESFLFSQDTPPLKLEFKIDPKNINYGFVKAENDSDFQFDVEIISKDQKKSFYKATDITPNVEKHFSFNNTTHLELFVIITPSLLPSTTDARKKNPKGFAQFKFETKIDSFDDAVSKSSIFEPAIYALEVLMKKLNDVMASSKQVSDKIEDLGSKSKNVLIWLIILSFITLVAYTFATCFQFYHMRKFLNEKKYL